MDADADIAAWLDEHESAWNTNDVPAMFARSSPDLHWINVVGMHWQGQDAVIKAHQILFEIMFNDVPISLLGLDSIVRLGDGTRIAVARWRLGAYATPDGHRITGEANRMTLVFSGRDETLQLRHVANLRIDANAAPHDPITSG